MNFDPPTLCFSSGAGGQWWWCSRCFSSPTPSPPGETRNLPGTGSCWTDSTRRQISRGTSWSEPGMLVSCVLSCQCQSAALEDRDLRCRGLYYMYSLLCHKDTAKGKKCVKLGASGALSCVFVVQESWTQQHHESRTRIGPVWSLILMMLMMSCY